MKYTGQICSHVINVQAVSSSGMYQVFWKVTLQTIKHFFFSLGKYFVNTTWNMAMFGDQDLLGHQTLNTDQGISASLQGPTHYTQ